MSNHTGKNARRGMALRVALVALAVAGGVAIELARHDADVVAAQPTGPAAAETVATGTARTVTLYKSPTCTCCRAWGEHLREAGFEVREVVSDTVPAIMEEHGVPMHLRSCHLGVMGDYVLVGHVPGDLAVRLLRETPAVTGIAVPGMPLGSPGMEGLGRKDPYDVIAFGPNGGENVFASR